MFGTGWGTLGKVQHESENFWGGAGRVGGPSESFGTGQWTLPEVWDGSGILGVVWDG